MKVNCKNAEQLEKRKSFQIEVHDDRLEGCMSLLGSFTISSARIFPLDTHVFLEVNKATDVILRPKITTTDESLRRFNPTDRNCYFEDEKKLKYFTKYSKNNCLDECWSDLSFDICGCVHYYLIRKFC